MITCKAAIGDGKGQFKIDQIEVGDPAPGEVRVRLMASGICHTDSDSLGWGNLLVLGHEGAGIVDKVGDGVESFAVGDKVLLNWAIPCGGCYQCTLENFHLCEEHSILSKDNGTGGHAEASATRYQGQNIVRSFNLGTMSEYTVVKKEALVKIVVDIPFTSACIIGCGVMTGYGSVVNAAKVTEGSQVVVLGTGGVGLNVIQGAKISGARKIIAIDLSSTRLEMAKQFGATHTLKPQPDDKELLEAAKSVRDLTQGRGADYAFECTAVPALGAAPLAMIRHGGMAVQVSGIEQRISFDMQLFEWDKTYINPLYGKCRPDVDFPRILKLYESNELKLDEMITKTYDLNDLGQAFEDMHHGKNAKGVLVFDHEL